MVVSCGGGSIGGNVAPSPISTYRIQASAGANGTISPTSITVNDGQTALFDIVPDNGYVISSISGCNGVLNENTYTTAAISSSCSISVSFAKYITTVFSSTAYELPY